MCPACVASNSSNGRGSRIHGRNSGGVHRQVHKIVENQSSRAIPEIKEKLKMATNKNKNE